MSQLQEIKGARAKALVLQCMIRIIRDNLLQYGHGVTRKELESKFPLIMHFSLGTYGNRMRDLAHPNDQRAMRHTVHRERHYFPTLLHEDGTINHENCDCEATE